MHVPVFSFRICSLSFTVVQKESSLSFSEWVPLHDSPVSLWQPYAKRARPGCPLGEEYGAALQAAVGALDTLESLLHQAPAPDGLLSGLEMLHGRIDELKRRVL